MPQYKDEYLERRNQMVEAQIISRGIKDRSVIQAFLKIPRHFFVEDSLKPRAYDDNPLPIGLDQTISQPYMVAFMLEHLDVKNSHKVLEIGTGSGYQTALLAELAREVYTIERLSHLSQIAQETLKQLGYNTSGSAQLAHVYYKIDDGTLGWPEFAPYDRIIISAAAPDIPHILVKQLADNGIMLCPVGNEYYQELIRITKSGAQIEKDNLGPCVFVKLVGKEGWKE
jgi:protein-L-isoaspartate(D-aspartate) O-methyltransferase